DAHLLSLVSSFFTLPASTEIYTLSLHDALPIYQLYSALVFAGGAAWRKRLHDEIGDQGPVSALIDKRSDEELAALMNNLGGHDRSEEHTSELQSRENLVCRLLLEKKKSQ